MGTGVHESSERTKRERYSSVGHVIFAARKRGTIGDDDEDDDEEEEEEEDDDGHTDGEL